MLSGTLILVYLLIYDICKFYYLRQKVNRRLDRLRVIIMYIDTQINKYSDYKVTC